MLTHRVRAPALLRHLADGSAWVYEYDPRGQVKSGKRYWSDWTPVAGQQFEYAFDDIGNRASTKAGGNAVGTALRAATYSANTLNQITQRDVPGAVDIIGAATAASTSVTVNNQSAYRRGEYYQLALSINNGSTAQWTGVTNLAVQSGTTNTVIGNTFLPQTPEIFSYDADGNQTNDGRWMLTWDAENRLTKIESQTSAPVASKRKITFDYDWAGRHIRRTDYNGATGSYVLTNDVKFLNDGLHCIAELNATNNSLLRSYLWGSDLSGTMSAAAGVGGLLAVNAASNGVHFCACDGNGNVTALVNGSDGTGSANYEWGPFGEPTRATGPMARVNPFRFSTEYCDDESDLTMYPFRPYSTSTGRFLCKDPSEEEGGLNLYAFVGNNPINLVDPLGLWPTDVHHQIVSRWLLAVPYDQYPWHCCKIPVRSLLQQGSDQVDGVDIYVNFPSAQSSATAYQHAMKNSRQTEVEAFELYILFEGGHILTAVSLADKARQRGDSGCSLMYSAIRELGKAYHSYSDSLSPAHAGFQPWYGPIDGVKKYGLSGYKDYLRKHKEDEADIVFQGNRERVVWSVQGQFQWILDAILQP